MKNKTVLLAIGCSKIGGAQKMFATIAKGLIKRYYNVIIALPEGKLAEMLRDEGIDIVIVDFKSFAGIRQIARVLKHRNIDIVNTHLTNCSFFFAIVNIFYRKPLVCSLHNAILHEGLGKVQRFIFPFIYHLIYKLCKGIIVNSSKNKEHFVEVANIKAEHIEVIYNGIDPDEYQSDNVQEGRNGKKFQIGYIGRLSIEKGVTYLIKALSGLGEIDFEVIVVGEGPLRVDLENDVHQKGLSGRVKFVGFQENVVQYFEQMDVFILPSLNEVMPITIIEAFALRKIVIASEVGGVPDLVEDMVTGLLFPPKDVNELKKCIRWVYKNQKIANAIAEHAHQVFLSNFTSESMVQKTTIYYDYVSSQ